MTESSQSRPALVSARRPTVTVLVTCYNYGRFLNQCVSSVLAQTGVDVSVVVVDDASSDESACVIKAFAKHDQRVKPLLLSENLGMVRAVNKGLHYVDSDYFVKLDADDLLSEGSLERSIALLEQYPDVGFVYGRPRHFTGSTPPRPRLGHIRWTVWPGAQWLALRYQRAVNCISQPEAVIRTSTLRAVGGYNTQLPHTSDLEMWLRLAAVSNVGRVNGPDQGFYRVHPGSMQHTVNAGLLTDFIGRRSAFISAIRASTGKLHGATDLEAMVRRELAAQALDCACRAFDRDRVEIVPISELIKFAKETYTAAPTLTEWHALQRRQRGGRRSRWAPSSLFASMLRRSREEIAYARWIRTGV